VSDKRKQNIWTKNRPFPAAMPQIMSECMHFNERPGHVESRREKVYVRWKKEDDMWGGD
jgi:hypothetical protein